MAAVDRWSDELIALQEAFVWLVPEKQLAVTLVEEAGLLTDFIDFGEPVYLRIKRILLEATKRNMMIPLMTVLTRWYPENQELKDAIIFWTAGEDRKAAANLIMKAARQIADPIAVAKVTRIGGEVKEVEVAVTIPTVVIDDPAALVPVSTPGLPTTPAPSTVVPSVPKTPAVSATPTAKSPSPVPEVSGDTPNLQESFANGHSDEPEPGDWYSIRKTLVDHEAKILEMKTSIRELTEWRRLLSSYPSITPRIDAKPETAEDVKKEAAAETTKPVEGEKKP